MRCEETLEGVGIRETFARLGPALCRLAQDIELDRRARWERRTV